MPRHTGGYDDFDDYDDGYDDYDYGYDDYDDYASASKPAGRAAPGSSLGQLMGQPGSSSGSKKKKKKGKQAAAEPAAPTPAAAPAPAPATKPAPPPGFAAPAKVAPPGFAPPQASRASSSSQEPSGGTGASEELVAAVVGMGFPRHSAERACLATGNASVEAALDWVLAHMDDPALDQPPPPSADAVAAELHAFKFDTPSPDDAVMEARDGTNPSYRPSQAHTRPTERPAPKPSTASPASAASGAGAGPGPGAGAEAVVRRPVSEYKGDTKEAEAEVAARGGREALALVVVGHVDAGKSTLMGRLLHALGQVDAKQAHKNARDAKACGKSSFAWAWALDQRPEERERGVTVDVALAHVQTARYDVAVLDAPGHRDFVPHMLGGAAQADAALLVVDASPGGFEAGFAEPQEQGGGGQTREHAQLVRSLGVECLCVVVNKLDVVGYSEARFSEIRGALLPFLKKLGFKQNLVQWVPVSGFEGVNLNEPPPTEGDAAALAQWWSGAECPTLLAAVDGMRAPQRQIERPLRLPVAEVVAGAGRVGVGRSLGPAVVAGKVEGGWLKVGQKVLCMPANQTATVKGLEIGGKAANIAVAGDSADVGLSGIEAEACHGGMVLCHAEWPVAVVSAFEARLLTLDLRVPLLPGTPVTVHLHSREVPGRVAKMLALLDPRTAEVTKKRPRAVCSRQLALVLLRVESPVCIEPYADFRSLGRVTLRASSDTLAVGTITSVDVE